MLLVSLINFYLSRILKFRGRNISCKDIVFLLISCKCRQFIFLYIGGLSQICRKTMSPEDYVFSGLIISPIVCYNILDRSFSAIKSSLFRMIVSRVRSALSVRNTMIPLLPSMNE